MLVWSKSSIQTIYFIYIRKLYLHLGPCSTTNWIGRYQDNNNIRIRIRTLTGNTFTATYEPTGSDPNVQFTGTLNEDCTVLMISEYLEERKRLCIIQTLAQLLFSTRGMFTEAEVVTVQVLVVRWNTDMGLKKLMSLYKSNVIFGILKYKTKVYTFLWKSVTCLLGRACYKDKTEIIIANKPPASWNIGFLLLVSARG